MLPTTIVFTKDYKSNRVIRCITFESNDLNYLKHGKVVLLDESISDIDEVDIHELIYI